MKMVLSALFILLWFYPKSQNNYLKNDYFENGIEKIKLHFKMPRGFYQPDSIKKKMYIAKRIYNVNYQINSDDNKVKICFLVLKQNQDLERKVKLVNPNYNISKEYLTYIPFLCKNIGVETFEDGKISYYNRRLLRKLNIDNGVEYIIRLKEPYEGKFSFLKYTFLLKKYNFKVEIFQFYEDINNEHQELKTMIRYKND